VGNASTAAPAGHSSKPLPPIDGGTTVSSQVLRWASEIDTHIRNFRTQATKLALCDADLRTSAEELTALAQQLEVTAERQKRQRALLDELVASQVELDRYLTQLESAAPQLDSVGPKELSQAVAQASRLKSGIDTLEKEVEKVVADGSVDRELIEIIQTMSEQNRIIDWLLGAVN